MQVNAFLAEVEQALDDWIVTYAADHCDPAQVRAAWKRLMDNGGTIAYVTDLRERVHSANDQASSMQKTIEQPERGASLPPAPGSPIRVRLSRAKGWKMPPNTVNVARPTKWGNPFSVKEYGRWGAVDRFKVFMTLRPAVRGQMLNLEELRGKNLACWCAPNEFCHADVLLMLANDQAHL